jgi:hypothetical protein
MLANEDRAAISDLINLYHYWVDEPGFPRLREIFTDDCLFDLSDYGRGVLRGIDALASLFAGDSSVLAHSCTNIVIFEEPVGLVRCTSKCLALLPQGKMGLATHKDVLRHTPQGRRIAERVPAMPIRLKN